MNVFHLLSRSVPFMIAATIFAGAQISPVSGHELVAFSGFSPGTIIVKTRERRLYFAIDTSHALKFPVGVGRTGMTWTGTARIEGKYIRPDWAPPQSIRHENPRLPTVIPGGAANNPMGAAALTLRGGEYAIHGTNRPASIGSAVSHGCIRMYNSDVLKLYRLVHVGTPVIVTE